MRRLVWLVPFLVHPCDPTELGGQVLAISAGFVYPCAFHGRVTVTPSILEGLDAGVTPVVCGPCVCCEMKLGGRWWGGENTSRDGDGGPSLHLQVWLVVQSQCRTGQ